MYLVPLLLLELVVFLAKGGETTTWRASPPTPFAERALSAQSHHLMSNLAMTFQAGMWIWAVGCAVRLGPPPPNSWLGCLDVFAVLGLPAVLTVTLERLVRWIRRLPRDHEFEYGESCGFLMWYFANVAVLLVVLTFPFPTTEYANVLMPEIWDYVRAAFFLELWTASFWSSKVCLVYLLRRSKTRLKALVRAPVPGLAIYIFVTNLVFAMIYYTHGWQPSGTVKPPWIEYLG